MSTFKLMPCKLRDWLLCPIKGAEVVTLDWKELQKKLIPKGDVQALRNLRQIETFSFIGLIRSKRDNRPVSFYMLNKDRTGDVSWLLEKDPSFAGRLLEGYRVDEAPFDGKRVELNPPQRRNEAPRV